ncbi:MAG TPA: radical SAM protein [Anaerolineae bacterium]|nr:radical SAM protein [Anaerolineae bacterium]
MMDILLSHGYFIAEDEHEQQIMKPYPPLGLLYISSHLKHAGFDVDLYDTTFRDLNQFAAHLQQHRPPIVGLYVNMMTKFNILRQIEICQEINATIILGGPEPVNYAPEYLAAGAHIIVNGEGELTLADLIPHLQQHGLTQLDNIPGILFHDPDGNLITTSARQQIKPLAHQPWPDRQAINLEQYLNTWQTHHGVRSTSLITARGCPYTCRWCSHSVFGHSHRRREPADVADEVEWLLKTYQVDQLWYADDVFTINKRWFKAYAAELAARHIKIPFECISRADRLDEETIDLLAQMGCDRLWLGAESGSQRILDAMDRKTDAVDVQQKTKMLQARGIEVGMFIMLGYQNETVADIEATADHLKKSGPDIFLTTVAYPIKGTKFYADVEESVASELSWLERTDRDLTINGRYSPAFYNHATRWLVNTVNLHQARQQPANSPRHWLRLTKLAFNTFRGRLGMHLTQHQREEATPTASGRGWPAAERATNAW